jgi:polysulfide reductase chain C (sulfur reductase chain C)
MFYIGVIGLGMAVPIILDLSVLKVHDFKREFAVLNAILVICGVFLLRYYIVYAGQIFI